MYLDHWPSHFKTSSLVIISKPNKTSYNFLKSYCPICYELKPLELGKRTNSCIRVNTRELDRDLFTNWSTLYTTTNGSY